MWKGTNIRKYANPAQGSPNLVDLDETGHDQEKKKAEEYATGEIPGEVGGQVGPGRAAHLERETRQKVIPPLKKNAPLEQ